MKRHPLTTAALALLPATLLTFTSCSSAPKVDKTIVTAYRQGVPGGTFVETYKITVTVKDIDAATHKVTLLAPDGSQNTFTAGPGDKNYDQLRVGEQVQATVTRQVVAFLRKDGPPPKEEPVPAVALAPEGAQSGVLKAATVQRSAKVGSVDQQRRQATLQFPDGTSKTFDIRKDVDLQGVNPGDDVVIRTRSAVVLTLEKP